MFISEIYFFLVIHAEQSRNRTKILISHHFAKFLCAFLLTYTRNRLETVLEQFDYKFKKFRLFRKNETLIEISTFQCFTEISNELVFVKNSEHEALVKELNEKSVAHKTLGT